MVTDYSPLRKSETTMETHLYFDSKHLPSPRGEFIAWCDGMGTGQCLARSLHQAANSVFKLHSAFSIARRNLRAVRCYPVMDGVYVTSPTRADMQEVLKSAFCELAREFINKPSIKHMHMMRAGLAFGPTLHGTDTGEAFYGTYHGYTTTREMFKESDLDDVRRHVVLSPAMILAYEAERSAPPFGIFVDDSAKSYPQLTEGTGGGFRSSLYQWWTGDEAAREVAGKLYDQIEFYLNKSETHSVGVQYAKERIEKHRILATEYFGGLLKDEKSP
jgi:hypothetical protein